MNEMICARDNPLYDYIDKLKVCGTCRKMKVDTTYPEWNIHYCAEDGPYDYFWYERDPDGNHREVFWRDKCFFSPSRWTPYWSEDD